MVFINSIVVIKNNHWEEKVAVAATFLIVIECIGWLESGKIGPPFPAVCLLSVRIFIRQINVKCD